MKGSLCFSCFLAFLICRRFRPQSSEMDVWPRVEVDSEGISSPFVERIPDRRVQQRSAAQQRPSQATTPAAKSPEGRYY